MSERVRLWNDVRMIALAKIAAVLLGDALRFAVLFICPSRSLIAENLFLRRQLALYKERGLKPHRIDAATRINQPCFPGRTVRLALRLGRCTPRDLDPLALSGPGGCCGAGSAGRDGPRIPLELRQLIGRIARENPLWGEERIANELRLKLGLRVSPRTVRKYMPKRPPGWTRGDQRWSTFLRNHAKALIACDFFLTV